MKSLIKDMYDGKTRPFGEYHLDTPRYKAGIAAENQAREELIRTFPECKSLLDKLDDANLTIIDETAYTQFLIGFRMGAQLAIEMTQRIE